MINFDGVDFSECSSEEVMFLLTLSVYTCMIILTHTLKKLTQSRNFRGGGGGLAMYHYTFLLVTPEVGLVRRKTVPPLSRIM